MPIYVCALYVFVYLQTLRYFETSAKEGINVEQAFQCIAKMALKQESEDDIYLPDTITINDQQQEKKDGCAC
jgi:Ras-related protein Rab-7A